jgi:prevent-host-death family protein
MNAQTERNAHWQLQEAKAMFSAVIKAAAEEPQIITVRGEETAVVLSMTEYRRLTQPKQSIVEFFRNSPWADVELDLERDTSYQMRNIDL